MKRLKCFWLVSLISVIVYSQVPQAPHQELIKPLENGMELYLENGVRYEIKLNNLIKVNNKFYYYGAVHQNNVFYDLIIKRYPIIPQKIIFVLEKDGNTYTLNDLRKVFQGETGNYKLYLNARTETNTIILDGSVFILDKDKHLNRNKYNKVAKGILIKKSYSITGIYIDECGTEWRKIINQLNQEHDPSNTVKFLRNAPGDGEYETIRQKLKGENNDSNKFHGPNIITGDFRGTYNFKRTLTNLPAHSFFDYIPNKQTEWGNRYENKPEVFTCSNLENNTSTTLFLIDRSGSMGQKGVSGKPKIEEAKEAAYYSLNSLQNNQEAGFLTFSGSCVDNPTASQSLIFSSNAQEVQGSIGSISSPSGGTPLKEAVDSATNRLQDYISSKGSDKPAKLIVLSDGVSSCNKIRPPNVYATGNQPLQRSTTQNPSVVVKYYTIGFDIKPGSEAERDLQYLAQTSGGKYLNAQNEFELTRAFQRFFRVYNPKLKPSTNGILEQDSIQFQDGILKIFDETYDTAKDIFVDLYTSYNDDYNIIFNLALMFDANNYYSDAIKMYEQYLLLKPKAKDYNWVLQQIELLKQDRDFFFQYTKGILVSDLEYLEHHFKKIQNGQSLRLAEEFKGFIEEKQNYYKILTKQLNIENKQIQIATKDISRGFQNCSKFIKKEPENWDKNASPILSMIYINMQRLIDSL